MRRLRVAVCGRPIAEVVENGPGERIGVSRANQRARHSRFDELDVAPDTSCDDRKARRHRLENRVGHAFGERGQHEAVQPTHELRNIGAFASEPGEVSNTGIG